ncbi:MAG: prepilin-type N-terminal cleavage/methylation domain-containing protein [bacterium]|nr:prepilin-type N-terminal cleavage/methylation domain-containing protein [bacterium]
MLRKKSKGLTLIEILIAIAVIALCILTISFTYMIIFTNQNNSFYIDLVNKKIELHVRKNPNITRSQLQEEIDNDKDINVKVIINSVIPNDFPQNQHTVERTLYQIQNDGKEIKIKQKIKEITVNYKIHNQTKDNELKIYLYYVKKEIQTSSNSSSNSGDSLAFDVQVQH